MPVQRKTLYWHTKKFTRKIVYQQSKPKMENRMSPVQNLVNKLQHDQIEMILHGLEMLDQFYNEESEFDKVMEVRDLKTTVQKHVPTHILN